jgi:hypothetical protein
MESNIPEQLKRYKKDPLDILDGRVLPPAYPRDVKLKKLSHIAGTINKGRPAKYPCAEALQYAVELYMERFDQTIPRDEEWRKRYPSIYPTIPGLVYALGFASKDEFKRQAQRDEGFKFVVEQAFTRIEEFKNDLLLKGGNSTTGAMHDLVNHHGWTTKVEQNTTLNAGSDLAALVQALQGKVLRPVLPIQDNEEIEDAEYAETEANAEEVDEVSTQAFPNSEEYAEDGEIEDSMEDLL